MGVHGQCQVDRAPLDPIDHRGAVAEAHSEKADNAAQIVGRTDSAVANKLEPFKKELAAAVVERDRKLQSERKKN